MGFIFGDKKRVFVGTFNLLLVGFLCVLLAAVLSKSSMIKFGNLFTSECKSDKQTIFTAKSVLIGFGFICYSLGVADAAMLTFIPHTD